MNKPLLVGITGGIGSGKSIISHFFQVLNISVYNSDDRGKYLMAKDKELIGGIKDAFGEESYFADGGLNRAFLASEVFSNEEKLKVLNELVHPVVGKDFEGWIQANSEHPYLLKEAALLFETGIYKQLDKTICVMVSKEVRLERVLLRDAQRSSEQIENIMSKQVSDSKRKKLSDFLINNDGSQLLIPQVLELHNTFLNLSAQRA